MKRPSHYACIHALRVHIHEIPVQFRLSAPLMTHTINDKDHGSNLIARTTRSTHTHENNGSNLSAPPEPHIEFVNIRSRIHLNNDPDFRSG